jgi:hypothetical protein
VLDKVLVMVVVIAATLSVTYPPIELLPFDVVRKLYVISIVVLRVLVIVVIRLSCAVVH